MDKSKLPRAKKLARLMAIFSVSCVAWPPRLVNAEPKYSASLRITSDYVYRGYSKSRGDPAIQMNVDYEHPSGMFIGSWISQVDFGDQYFSDRASIEANPYAGASLRLLGYWRIDSVLAGYVYDGKVDGRDSDYGDLYALLHYRDLFTARWGVSHDAYGRGKSTLNYELDARFPLTDTLEVSSGIGYENTDTVLRYNYIYWNIGAAWFFPKHATIDLRYHDAHRFSNLNGEIAGASFEPPRIGKHFVFSLSIGF